MIILTEKIWDAINLINQKWNDSITPLGIECYGLQDTWTYPGDIKGDCKEFVVAKKYDFGRLDIPSYPAICRVYSGDYYYHAVLLIDTDRGTFVLDNLCDAVKHYQNTGYEWYKRMKEDGKWYQIVEE